VALENMRGTVNAYAAYVNRVGPCSVG